jgi:hypothetical protein
MLIFNEPYYVITELADVASEWSSTLLYTLPPPFSNALLYYAYAVKLHPHLASSPDEMIITYVYVAIPTSGSRILVLGFEI